MEYLIILGVCLAVYSQSWNYGPVVDDIGNREKYKLRPSVHYSNSFLARIRRRLNGQAPFENIYLDRAITVVIHTAVCLLMFEAFGSLVASLLFAVNVSNNQVSLWLNGKRYGINAILCLLAFIFAPVGILFWFITPWFQASAVVFPILLAVKGYWYFAIVPPLALVVGGGYLRKWMDGRASMVKLELKTWNYHKIPFILKTIAFYFFRGLIPFVPVMYITYLKHYGLIKKHSDEAYRFDLPALVGLLLVLGIPYLYLLNPTLFFGLLWWLVMSTVYSNWTSITVIFAERYCYLPNIGLMFCLAKVLEIIHPSAWLLVFGIYLARLISYMPMYKDIETYLKHHTDTDPTHDCAWNIRIQNALFAGDILLAQRHVDEAISYIKDSPRLWVHKAAITYTLGRKDMSAQFFQKARECAVEGFRDGLLPKIIEIERQTNQQGEQ